MKRIKSANGYTIYQATTQRDADNYGCQIGNYNVYTSQDIRDYGLSYSYPEYDNIDSLTYALVICNSSRYAVAVALADELSDSTAQDMDLCLAIEQRLDAGEALETVRRCYDRETGRLYESISDAIAHGYDPYCDDFDPYEDHPSVGYDEDGKPHIVEDECEWDDDDLADDEVDPDAVIDALAAGELDDVPENNWYISVRLRPDLRDELAEGHGCYDTIDEIESVGLWGMAVLELGYADIEVNVTRPEGNAICAEYFVCLKQEDGGWFSHGYIDRCVGIDWTAANWENLLHEEMRTELLDYAAEQGWDLTTPFVEEETAAWAGVYAAEQCPVEPEQQPAPKQERSSHASYYVVETCDSDCQWLTIAPTRPAELTDEQYRRLFFRKLAERIAFEDCSDEQVNEIVFDGEPCHYTGWQPGMVIEFASDITGEIVYSGIFPEWDH